MGLDFSPMSRATVRRVLIAYFGVVLFAVFFQIDGFPLTWMPMYSYRAGDIATQPIEVRIRNGKVSKAGFWVTHADGARSQVGAKELNLPKRSMKKLYFNRGFLTDGPSHRYPNQQRMDELSIRFRNLIFGEEGERITYTRRLFRSLNKTLGLSPGDPRFIVQVEAEMPVKYFDHQMQFHREELRQSDRRWNEAWSGDFDE